MSILEETEDKLRNREHNVSTARARIAALGYMQDIRLTEEYSSPEHLGEDFYYLVGSNNSRIIFKPWGLDPEVRVEIHDNIDSPWQEVLRMDAGDFATAPMMVEIASDVSDEMRELAEKMTGATREKDGAWFDMELPATRDDQQNFSLITENRLYHLTLDIFSGRRGRLRYRDRWSLDLADKAAVKDFHFSDIVKADEAYEARLEAEREKMRREFEERSKPTALGEWVRRQVNRVRRHFGSGGPRP